MTSSVRPARRVWFLAVAAFAVLCLAGCCGKMPRSWKNSYDPPMNHEGREQICLHNLEKLLDAKQEWASENGTQVGALCPSAESLAHKYFRRYEYGRRQPWDDDTQKLPLGVPMCPRGGEYIMGTVGQRPKCSACGDLLRDYDTHTRVGFTH